MRLSWNEIRVRAKSFSEEWKDAHYEKGETQSFYNDFFEVFGLKRRQVGRYEEAVKDLKGNSQFIDLFWPGMLIVEQKSEGRDLKKAESQAFRYFDLLKEREQPRYILVCDFQTFQLRDLADRDVLEFPLADLHKHVQKFGFMIGVERREFKDQDPVNIKAAELVGKLHDALEEAGYVGRDLEVFLVQIVFCLFADDTGVFQPKDIFLQFLEGRTAEDGSDLGAKLTQLFQTLDTPEDRRSKHLDEDLAQFPYINGRLFERQTRIPSFDSEMREKLIEASRFDWSPISPAIFGALFQSVMDKDERRKKGAHYTTEKNIMKVIGPLFLDELWAEFDKAKNLKRGKNNALDVLSTKLGQLTFFDPACGCGNFLIIAYRELRRLEIALLKERLGGANLELDASILSNIDVDQFYGIELEEFPARIAETAMWMMDHIMNNELSLAFGQNFARIPLEKAANIVHGDALELDWDEVLPAEECDYVFGNPPFSGFVLRDKEKASQALAMKRYKGIGGRLDYVSFWFLKASEYSNHQKAEIQIAFVSTNSITQGEQVSQLWPYLFDAQNMEINFAYRTFPWGSDARGKAQVHCIIVGFSPEKILRKQKALYSFDRKTGETEESSHKKISPYLFSADGLNNPKLTVQRTMKPLCGQKRIRVGTKPVDGGVYILEHDEGILVRKRYPEVADFIRPFIGGKELMSGNSRWLICTPLIPPQVIAKSNFLKSKIANAREVRSEGGSLSVELADTPTRFHTEVFPEENFLGFQETGSVRREFFPLAHFSFPTTPSNTCLIVADPLEYYFPLLCSSMHYSWVLNIGGSFKSDPRYSSGIVYNTFPWPNLTDKAKETLTKTGQAILDARAEWPDATLADLYDPDAMPANLRKAHHANDKAVDKLYRKKPFESERERVEHLFMLYEQMTAPIEAAAKPKPKRRRAKTVKTS